ncbi:hypothetical protein [Nocardioides zeae]|uniref:Lipoprotein n=1 Tax=Nocardioides zeae TaxID=1457234 RepID=A0A6P0HJE8_9ACTN|nr:hypothetical protein [Nocardioides zeae]NEN78731.1 hypothetical protein [Nocardioides zeae]
MRLLRSARATALGLGVGLVLASTAACSGSDPDDAADPTSSAPPESTTTSDPAEPSGTTEPTESSGTPEAEPPDTASTGEALPPVDGQPCSADVTLSGAVESSWEGEGVVAEGGAYGPTVTYQSTHEDHGVTLVAAGEGFDAAAYLTSGGAFFGSVPGGDGVEIDPAGGGAQVDVELVAPELEGDPVRLVATFTC